jgi:hypothetical protein
VSGQVVRLQHDGALSASAVPSTWPRARETQSVFEKARRAYVTLAVS